MIARQEEGSVSIMHGGSFRAGLAVLCACVRVFAAHTFSLATSVARSSPANAVLAHVLGGRIQRQIRR